MISNLSNPGAIFNTRCPCVASNKSLSGYMFSSGCFMPTNTMNKHQTGTPHTISRFFSNRLDHVRQCRTRHRHSFEIWRAIALLLDRHTSWVMERLPELCCRDSVYPNPIQLDVVLSERAAVHRRLSSNHRVDEAVERDF